MSDSKARAIGICPTVTHRNSDGIRRVLTLAILYEDGRVKLHEVKHPQPVPEEIRDDS